MKFIKTSIALLMVFLISVPALNAQSSGTSVSEKEAQAKKMAELEKYEEAKKREFEYLRQVNPAERTFVYSSGSNIFGGESSELSLRKSFNGQTVESKKSFEIIDKSSRISFSLTGNVESGQIEIVLVKPDGKNYITIQIDNTSDISWRQSINIDERNKFLKGQWQIIVKTTKADGSYNFRISAE